MIYDPVPLIAPDNAQASIVLHLHGCIHYESMATSIYNSNYGLKRKVLGPKTQGKTTAEPSY